MVHVTLLESWHEALRTEAREKFASVEPIHDEPSLKASVAKLGYYRYLLPASLGGARQTVDVRALCVIREELAYRDAAHDSVFAVQGLGSHPVLLAGSSEQKSQLLAQVADGRALFAFALTEPGAGSDVAALSTQARRDGDGYVLSGLKRFISNAGIASHYTVFARTSEGPKGISAFVVPSSTPGLAVKPMKLLGEHPIGEVHFDNCRIPLSARLGEEGAGMRVALTTLDTFRPSVGAAAVGLARRALDEAIRHVKTRRQFGAPLADLQGVQFHLAESAVELDAARLLVHRAAAAKDSGQARITYEAAVAKLFATEAAQRIIDRAVQMHGGEGVVSGHPVERLYRDVRALRIYEGASDVQKVVIARKLLE